MFSCKVSVAGSKQQNTQSWKGISGKKKYYSCQLVLAESKSWERGGKRHGVHLKYIQNDHLGNSICSSHWLLLFLQTLTVANSTFRCARVPGCALSKSVSTLGGYLPLESNHFQLQPPRLAISHAVSQQWSSKAWKQYCLLFTEYMKNGLPWNFKKGNPCKTPIWFKPFTQVNMVPGTPRQNHTRIKGLMMDEGARSNWYFNKCIPTW